MPRNAISTLILPPLAAPQIAGLTGEAARRHVDMLACQRRDATAAADPSHGLAQCRLIDAARDAEIRGRIRAAVSAVLDSDSDIEAVVDAIAGSGVLS